MAQIQKKFIAANAVDETKVRLSNNSYLKARNAANSGDVNILKVNASDAIEFASLPQFGGVPFATTAVVTQVITNGVTTTAPSEDAVFDALALKANTSSLATVATSGAYADLSGTPTNVSDFTNDSNFVDAAGAKAAAVADAINNGTLDIAPSQNAVFDALALKADLASPALTGTPTAPTAAPLTNTTQLATTAFVTAAVTAGSGLFNVVEDTTPELGGTLVTNNNSIRNSITDESHLNLTATTSELSSASTLTIATTGGNIVLNPNGSVAMSSKQITSMADGTSAQDAVTKSQMETADGLKVSKSGDTMSGTLNMGNNLITNVTPGAALGDAVEFNQFSNGLAAKLSLAGGTMTGNIDMSGTQKLTNLVAGTAGSDSIRKDQAMLLDGSQAMTAALDMGTFKITNLVDPTNPQEAATKFYVDNAIAGLSWKQAVHASSYGLGNISIATAPASIDSHTLTSGQRVLLTDQSTGSQNGIYDFNGAGNAMTRSSDMDQWLEVVGAVMLVEQGTLNGGGKFVNTNVSGGTLGTTAITFAAFSVAGSISGTGVAGYNSYWSAPTTLSSEQYVAAIRGGLATDASAFTGVLKAAAGVFTASAIVDADIAANTITESSISSSIAGDMIAGGSGTKLSVDLATVSGLESTNPGNVAGQLRVHLEASNPSLMITGGNELAVKIGNTSLTSVAAGLEVNLAASSGLEVASGLKAKVDAATVKINGSNALESLKPNVQTITLSGTDITNQYIDAAYAVYGTSASVNSAVLKVDGAPTQTKGVDYTISLTGGVAGVTRFTFAGDLATAGAAALVAGDILELDYSYLT
jgi:hypothetical protein